MVDYVVQVSSVSEDMVARGRAMPLNQTPSCSTMYGSKVASQLLLVKRMVYAVMVPRTLRWWTSLLDKKHCIQNTALASLLGGESWSKKCGYQSCNIYIYIGCHIVPDPACCPGSAGHKSFNPELSRTRYIPILETSVKKRGRSLKCSRNHTNTT